MGTALAQSVPSGCDCIRPPFCVSCACLPWALVVLGISALQTLLNGLLWALFGYDDDEDAEMGNALRIVIIVVTGCDAVLLLVWGRCWLKRFKSQSGAWCCV